MNYRNDRIHYPPIISEDLWKCPSLPFSDNTSSNGISRFGAKGSGVAKSMEVMTSPVRGSSDRMHSSKSTTQYFEFRERAGIMTPAKTPSDILRRCPIYMSSTDSDALSHIGDALVSPSQSEGCESSLGVAYLQEQIAFHSARGAVIEAAMLEFEGRMRKLRDWHRDQELINRNLLSKLD